MKYVLVDGFNLAFRAYHAMPALTRRDGFPVGALHGWVRILWKLLDQETPCRLTVFFDKDGSRRHLALHAGYKANRAETPPALVAQIPELKAIAAHLGFALAEQSGVEADDLIASAAGALDAQGHSVRIASSDKDFAQCVNARVNLLVPPPAGAPKTGWTLLDADGVNARFGVSPERIVDYLALTGDTVDNIEGIPGVGPKTAVAWLAKHGDLDGVLKDADAIEPPRFRPILRDSAALLQRNRELIAFRRDFQGDWDATAPVDATAARAFFERMEMRSSLLEFERRHGTQAPAQLELF
ncbi:MAG: hypothetical protein LBD14_04250 [Puniceicoccales bacterium]|jgi:DNA polymerase-1|nr:hypothetical protein [Puniceicoccales bacterium]